MCNKFPVMLKMPRHVTNQLSSSYFLCIFLSCTFLNMHYVSSSLLRVSPFPLNFVCCCLLAHKYKNQCRTVEDVLLGVEQKLRMKDSWPCLQTQRHGSGYFNREQKLLLPCYPTCFQRHMVKVKSSCSDSRCCGLHTFSHILCFWFAFQSYTAVTGTRQMSKSYRCMWLAD